MRRYETPRQVRGTYLTWGSPPHPYLVFLLWGLEVTFHHHRPGSPNRRVPDKALSSPYQRQVTTILRSLSQECSKKTAVLIELTMLQQ
jgi:hypothetical protein